ncbi:variable surface protein [Plasmodium gonderi]|uniref:Variable surface protein n=1 Tax=Plasmodium gonderi TaxID=77519 RepID=A0A1Y1JHM8_PLAGO|nr:variable surface protein [Plasmodium gonderi]GAW82031.1 variable surface protein [Plasmodium gonderi]
MEPITVDDVEEVAKKLDLDKIYDDFFLNSEKSKFVTDCDVFDNEGKKSENAKKICSKLVYFLEEIAKNKNQAQRNDQCNYLTYWFYGEIGKIHGNHSENISDVTFVKDLIDVGKNVYKRIHGFNKCDLISEKGTSLDEWTKRKISYIYFKKYDDIKDVVSKSHNKCNEYLKYLKNVNSLYQKYYKANCQRFFWWPSPNYINCNKTLNPNTLITIVEKCKTEVPSDVRSLWSIFGILSPSGSPRNKEAGSGKSTQDAETAKVKSKALEKVGGDKASAKIRELTGAPLDRRVESAFVEDQSSPSRNGESAPVKVQPPSIKIAEEPANVSRQVPISHIPTDNTYTTHATFSEVSINSFDLPKKIYETLKFLNFRKSFACATIIAAVIFLIFFFSSSRSERRPSSRIKKEKKYKNDVNSDSEEILSEHKPPNPHYIQESSSIYLSYNS